MGGRVGGWVGGRGTYQCEAWVFLEEGGDLVEVVGGWVGGWVSWV